MGTELNIPSATAPVYSTSHINQPICLYEGIADIRIGGQKVASGNSRICWDWLPSAGMRVDISNVDLNIPVQNFSDQAFGQKIQLLLLNNGVEFDADLIRFSSSSDVSSANFWRIDITCSLDKFAWIEEDKHLECVLGHLVNFPDLLGDPISYSKSDRSKVPHMARARVALSTKKWRIIIDGVSNLSEINKEIRRSKGYAITSSVKIERCSEAERSISLSDVRKIIEALYFFLSFAFGRYSSVILPVGFDSSGSKVWYEWNNWLVPQWEETISCFSGEKNCNDLPQLFLGFMKVWEEPNSVWCEPIKRSIVWYIESNRQAVDPLGKVIWVQSALELLSWTYFVSTGKKSEKAFKKIGGTCEKIKVFLDALEIPTSFLNTPKNLEHLGRFIDRHREDWQEEGNKKKRNLENYLYLKAFVEVRNDIVHPRKCYGEINYSSDSPDYENSFWISVEALMLGLWYLEMSLLRLFEYKGSYVSRLQNRELRTVPWAEM